MAGGGDTGLTVIERAAQRLESPGQVREPTKDSIPAPPPSELTRPIQEQTSRPRATYADINLKRLPKAGIFSPETTANRTTEEIRLIKQATLQQVSQAAASGISNANLIMVTSAREGEGKSFVAANLALSIAAEKK